MAAELLIDLVESTAYVVFLNLFLGSTKIGAVKYSTMAAASAMLFINIALADMITIYHWSTTMIDCVIIFVYGHFCLRGSWKGQCAGIILFNIGLIVSTVLPMAASSLWLPQGIDGWITTGTRVRAILLLAGKLILLVFLFFVLKIKNRFKDKDYLYNDKIFLSAPVLVIILSGILLYLLFCAYDRDGETQVYLVLLIGFLGLLMLIFYLMFDAMKKQKVERENQLLLEMIGSQKKLFTEEIEHHRKIRKIEHDMKNRLLAVKYYYGTGQIESGNHYLDQLISELTGSQNTSVILEDSLKYPWMALIQIKVEEAKIQDISISQTIRDGCYEKVNPMDLCVVIGNLLDNAVTAERKNTGKKEISLQVEEHYHYIHIFIKNWIEDALVKDIEKLLSEKKGSQKFYGTGLNNVVEITKKYGGKLAIEQRGNWFVVHVILAVDAEKL